METEWHVTVKFPYDNTMYICVNVYKYSKSINVEGKTAHGFLLMIASGTGRDGKESTVLIDCT